MSKLLGLHLDTPCRIESRQRRAFGCAWQLPFQQRRTVVAQACRSFGEPDSCQAQQTTRRALLLALSGSATVLCSVPEPASAGTADQVLAGGTSRLIESSEVQSLTPTQKQIYGLNRRVQVGNRAPDNFPGFIKEGFNTTVVADGYVVTPTGLIYKDAVDGTGEFPVDGQEVVFDYTGYNESGAVIDSTYRRGAPAQTRLGIAGLIPGFEEGIKSMKVGGKRRIVVPPELGPPVGPSTFFSAKQCEVFDVELRAVRNCVRQTVGMFSNVVCS